MTTPDDLDAGLDAGLETHPRWQVALLVITPWIVAPPNQGQLAYMLVTIPVAWAIWSWHASTRVGDAAARRGAAGHS